MHRSSHTFSLLLVISLLSLSTLSASNFMETIRGFTVSNERNATGKTKNGGQRDYWIGPSRSEEKTLRWIMTTLANATAYTLIKESFELKKKGELLYPMHPYNFLLIIFRDDELKCHARAIKAKGGLAKTGFYGGICTSLKQESAVNNLKPDYLNHFAKRIGMDPVPMRPFIEQKRWEEFVDYLILNAPRETDPNRYNM